MHNEQMNFCELMAKTKPEYFDNVKVLDLGSLDINGNNRGLFKNSFYLGVDLDYGPNVDLVSKAHELKFKDEFFDVIISTEMLEHDMYYPLSLTNMYRMLKPEGLLLLTCATTGREEHGTINSSILDSPFTVVDPDWKSYYKNLTKEDVWECFKEGFFSTFTFLVENKHHDLYFWGIKK